MYIKSILKFFVVLLVIGFTALLGEIKMCVAQTADECLGTCNLDMSLECFSDADCATVAGDTCSLPPDSCPAPFSKDASLTAVIANLHKIGPTCPPPTVIQGSTCILQNDVDLASLGTLDVSSFTHLNCQGHRIFTSHPGTGVTDRSQPEVAIHLAEAYGVKIQNCFIDGFDFPIFAHDIVVSAEAQADPGTLELLGDNILGNVVNGNFISIGLVKVDNMRIKDNTITTTRGSGFGIQVLRDSKLNQIKNNIITRQNSVIRPYVALPGPTTTSNPTLGSDGGPGLTILITQGTALPNLLNAIIGERLYQFPNAVPNIVDGKVENSEDFSADNIVEGNTITSCTGTGCIGVTNSQRAVIRDNQLSNIVGGNGLTFGALTLSGPFPGTCTLNPNRLCLNDTDCNIPTIDTSSQGSCANVTSKTVPTISEGAIIENNTIMGPFNTGMLLSTPDILVQGNHISGPVWPGTNFTAAGGVGIELRNYALTTATVTRNTISNVPAPLRLFSNANPTKAFTAKISLNDFTNYTDEVLAFPNYPLGNSELSDDMGRGNYWGLACPPTDLGFDPSKVLSLQSGIVQTNGTVSITGTPNPNVHDSHPYGVPVAGTDDNLLPLPCF